MQTATQTTVIVRASFGPRFTEKQRRALNTSNNALMAQHGGCWVNDYDCGRPDCVMGQHGGDPVAVRR